MDEPGERAGLRRLIAAWASDVQPDAPAGEGEPERPALDGRLLQCEIGGGAFAFPLAAVTEVVPYSPPRRLPGQPADAGVTMLRGRPLPALDAAARMGLSAPESAARMVVLATSSGPCAAVVADTGDIVEVPSERLSPPPAGAGASPYVTALVEIGGELVAVVDPDRLCRG
jgi:two-component system, chemotaxis family, chemotaxis protein CheV